MSDIRSLSGLLLIDYKYVDRIRYGSQPIDEKAEETLDDMAHKLYNARDTLVRSLAGIGTVMWHAAREEEIGAKEEILFDMGALVENLSEFLFDILEEESKVNIQRITMLEDKIESLQDSK